MYLSTHALLFPQLNIFVNNAQTHVGMLYAPVCMPYTINCPKGSLVCCNV